MRKFIFPTLLKSDRSAILCSAILLGFIFIIPFASAKSVLYISSANCVHSPLGCGCLGAEDKLFCEKIKELGYDVVIITEEDVRYKNEIWKFDIKESNLIFLGSVSEDILNRSKYRNDFCKNIDESKRKLFASFLNTFKSGDIQGCAFDWNCIGKIEDNNTKTSKDIWMTQTDFITKNYDLLNPYNAYSEETAIKVHNESGSIGVHRGEGFYAALTACEQGIFWGLDKPSKFTNVSWDLFKRAVLYSMNDHLWNITMFTIPEYPNANQSFWVFAKVFDRGVEVKEGNIASAFGDIEKSMAWSNETGYWESRSMEITGSGKLKIKTDGGDLEKDIKHGALNIDIISGVYIPGQTYTIKANIADGTAAYKIWDSDLEIRKQGELKAKDGVYTADVQLGSWGELILEVDAVSGERVGGSFKKISSTEAVKMEEFIITPDKWKTSAKEPGAESKAFTIKAVGREIKNIEIEKSGLLTGNLLIDTSGMQASLSNSTETSFKVVLDYSKLEEGAYDGKITVKAEGLLFDIPIELNYWVISGDFLRSEPATWSETVSIGGSTEKTFSLINNAPFPTTNIKVNASDELKGFISVLEKPDFIDGDSSEEIKIKLDASGMEEKTYYGTINVESLYGSAEIAVRFEVMEDISDRFESIGSRLESWGYKISEAKAWANMGKQQSLLDKLNTSLTTASKLWNQKKYTEAKARLEEMQTDIDALEEMAADIPEKPPFSIVTVVIIVVVLIIVGVAGYFGFELWKREKERKKKEKEKKGKIVVRGEERYRTEYY